MLNDMDNTDAVKAVVWERVGKLVQVVNYVNLFQRHDIQPNASRPFVFPATDIENLRTQRKFPRVASKARTALHCTEITLRCKLWLRPESRVCAGRSVRRHVRA